MTKKITFDNDNFTLSSGKVLFPLEIAYETFGKLNKDKTNAIFICHALTGEQYVSEINPITKKPGWWDILVGTKKPIDTSKYFVVFCSNLKCNFYFCTTTINRINQLIFTNHSKWFTKQTKT